LECNKLDDVEQRDRISLIHATLIGRPEQFLLAAASNQHIREEETQARSGRQRRSYKLL